MIAALLRHYGTWALFTALRLVFLAMLFAGLSLGYDVLSGQDTDFLTPLGVSGMGAMFLLALSVAPRTLSPWALRRLQALEPRAAVLSLVSSDSTFAKYELIDERGTRTFTLPDMACPGWSQPKDELLEVEARGEREGLWWIQDPFGKTFLAAPGWLGELDPRRTLDPARTKARPRVTPPAAVKEPTPHRPRPTFKIRGLA